MVASHAEWNDTRLPLWSERVVAILPKRRPLLANSSDPSPNLSSTRSKAGKIANQPGASRSRPEPLLPENAGHIRFHGCRRFIAYCLKQIDFNRAAHGSKRKVMHRIRKGIDEVISDRQDCEKHQTGNR